MTQHFKEKLSVTAIGVTTPLVDYIPDSEGLISYQARVSNADNQLNFETADKLLAYCARHGHWSIFDMSNLVLEIKAPRDISRQILRHSSAKFQEFCIHGDSMITTLSKSGSTKKVAIKDLYKRYKSSYWKRSDNLVRVYDEKSMSFITAKIKEVFDTGIKPTYRVKLGNGKEVVATEDHKLFTNEGFKEIKNIQVGDFVGCNGIPCYQNRDWLKKAKEESISNGFGLKYITEKAGISTHTIRKWLRLLDLTYSKKEVAQYTQAWNKGLDKEKQPRYGKKHSKETIEKMRDSSRKGEQSNLWTGSQQSWRKTVAYECIKHKRDLYEKQGGLCGITGQAIELSDCEVDHIEPVYRSPEKAFDVENLQVVSKEAHRAKSVAEMIDSRKSLSYSDVVSIEFYGDEQTYDLEVEHCSHNYVAGGIVTHNSQRYADVTDDMFCLRELRAEDNKNRQNSIAGVFSQEDESEWYDDQEEVLQLVRSKVKKWRERKAAKECTRVFMPEGLTMSNMYMNGTIRTWIHYTGLRKKRGETQSEHCDVADKCREFLLEYFPSLCQVLEENS